MILQSSNAIADWTIQADAEEKTKNLIKLSGSRVGTPQQNFESLSKMSLKDMFNNRTKCRDKYDRRRNMPVTLKPCIEMDNESAFITKAPVDIHKSENFEFSMPVLMGQNNGDALLQIDYYLNKIEKTNDDLVAFVPHSLMVELDSDEAKEIAIEMKNFYFGSRGLTKETIVPNFINLCSDIPYSNPNVMLMELCRKYHPKSRNFVYEFGLETKLNVIKPLTRVKELPGAFHSDELNYLFE